jgi:hypothetical protein
MHKEEYPARSRRTNWRWLRIFLLRRTSAFFEDLIALFRGVSQDNNLRPDTS